ncbi:MAG: hypothetical protein ACREKE_00105 [bacterium]
MNPRIAAVLDFKQGNPLFPAIGDYTVKVAVNPFPGSVTMPYRQFVSAHLAINGIFDFSRHPIHRKCELAGKPTGNPLFDQAPLAL